jgi:hypothetical protein
VTGRRVLVQWQGQGDTRVAVFVCTGCGLVLVTAVQELVGLALAMVESVPCPECG